MGISKQSIFSRQVDPEEHGKLNVHYPIEEQVQDVISKAKKPCLVITPSFQDAETIYGLVPHSIMRSTDETSAQASERVSEDGILITAGAWAGLDTPIQWASVIVHRIPFGKPTQLDKEPRTHYITSRNLAIRRMRQVVGRGLRRPESECDLYICDSRYSQLGNFLPTRFSKSWREGAKKEVKLSKAERDPEIRRAALKHYGKKCHCCEKRPKIDSLLEIHHLDPVTEGERMTTLNDFIPLCANCHKAAHSEKPPIPIEQLRNMDFWH